MLEGMAGVKIAYQEAYSYLSSKEEGLWFGDITLLLENFPEILRLYNQIITKLKNPSIRELICGGERNRKWVEEMNKKKIKNYEARYMSDDIQFGKTDQFIIGDTIMSFSLDKEIFVLIIESKEIAQTQRALFELAWSKAK